MNIGCWWEELLLEEEVDGAVVGVAVSDIEPREWLDGESLPLGRLRLETIMLL